MNLLLKKPQAGIIIYLEGADLNVIPRRRESVLKIYVRYTPMDSGSNGRDDSFKSHLFFQTLTSHIKLKPEDKTCSKTSALLTGYSL